MKQLLALFSASLALASVPATVQAELEQLPELELAWVQKSQPYGRYRCFQGIRYRDYFTVYDGNSPTNYSTISIDAFAPVHHMDDSQCGSVSKYYRFNAEGGFYERVE